MRRFACLRVSIGVCVAAIVGAWSPSAVQAQIGSREDITALFKQHKGRFDKQLNGEQTFDAASKADQTVVESLAKWYVYRMTWNYDGKKVEERLPFMVGEFDRLMANAANNASKNQAFLEHWSRHLTACFKDVFALKLEDHRLECMNTALMLPALARSKQDVVGDMLAGLITDEKMHDIIKINAVKGLREFFPVRAPQPNDDLEKKLLEKKARDVKRVEAVTAFFKRQPSLPKDAPKELLDAAIYTRREAIRTLAQAQLPAIEAERDKKGNLTKITAPIAYHLLRVLAAPDPDVHPPFTLSEKCEAAIGVCQTKSKTVDSYRVDVALFLVGNLLVEFLSEYRTDYVYFGGKDKEKEGKKVPLVAWKFQADRLQRALLDLKSNTPMDNDTHKGWHKIIDSLIDRSSQPLQDVRIHKMTGQPVLLQKLVDSIQPKSTSVYGNLAEYQLQLRGPAEEPEARAPGSRRFAPGLGVRATRNSN